MEQRGLENISSADYQDYADYNTKNVRIGSAFSRLRFELRRAKEFRGSEVIIDGTPIHFGRKSGMVNSGRLA